MTDTRERTLTHLRDPALAPLFAELRRRYEQSPTVRRVTLPQLTESQLDALENLLGWTTRPAQPITVTVADLDTVLAASPLACDTRTAVELTGGPVVDLRAERQRVRAERAELWDWLAAHPQVRGQPALAGWVEQLRRAQLGTPAEARATLDAALTVLAALPSDGRSLPRFAAQTLGDAHALDTGPVQAAVLRAASRLTGTPPPTTSADRRATWARVGVACDALSSTVIVAGFRTEGDGPTAATLRRWAHHGQAAHLTAAQLATDPLVALPSRDVWAVENPSVVHAALERYGPACPPMLCTSGWPSVAAVTAIRQLTRAGTTVRYHGDIDEQGLRIAIWLVERAGATPWRLTADDYLACVPPAAPAVTAAPAVPWDAQLTAAVVDTGRAQLEEVVTTALVDDLAQAAALPPV